jgi:hypothetical protein
MSVFCFIVIKGNFDSCCGLYMKCPCRLMYWGLGRHLVTLFCEVLETLRVYLEEVGHRGLALGIASWLGLFLSVSLLHLVMMWAALFHNVLSAMMFCLSSGSKQGGRSTKD